MANLVKIQQWKLAFCQIGTATLSLPFSLSPSLSLVSWLTFDVRGDEETLSVSGRRRNKLSVKDCRDSGFLSRSRFEVMLCFDTGIFCMNVWNFFLLNQAFRVFQMSLFKLLTATGMVLAIGGRFRWVVVPETAYYWYCSYFFLSQILGDWYTFFLFLFLMFLTLVPFLIIQVRKGDAIGEFLRAVQQQLAPEFREIRTTSVENLLYVKEDLIIPHVRYYWKHV